MKLALKRFLITGCSIPDPKVKGKKNGNRIWDLPFIKKEQTSVRQSY